MRHTTPAYSVVIFGLLGAVLVLAQVCLAPLPNIELVSLLILVYTRVYGRRACYPVCVFIVLEGLLFGFGLWWLSYLYLWPIWTLVVWLMRRVSSPLTWAVVCGAFGLSFGALCALPYAAAGGLWAGVSYWISGIPFDLLHCAGNFVLTLLLCQPLVQLLTKLQA